MCVCIYMCVYVYIYTHIYIYVHIYIFVYIHKNFKVTTHQKPLIYIHTEKIEKSKHNTSNSHQIMRRRLP